jgi:hypothetical protein
MARVKWNPEKKSPDKEPLPVVWGCEVFMRANGTFETFFKGQTGFEMMKAAVEALHAIERLRMEPAYDFGANRGEDGKPEGW